MGRDTHADVFDILYIYRERGRDILNTFNYLPVACQLPICLPDTMFANSSSILA